MPNPVLTNVKTLLGLSTTWRTLCGATSGSEAARSAAAEARVIIWGKDADTTLPVCLIAELSQADREEIAVGVFKTRGEVKFRFIFAVPAVASEALESATVTGYVDDILTEMCTSSASLGLVGIRGTNVEGRYKSAPEEVDRPCWEIDGAIRYEGGI